jgi:oxygen-independent coproporphyrinogen-3 oxidase
MNAADAALAERNAPRYTSYPTAPHFHAGIGALDYAQWLEALPPKATLSLYIHVPFCTDICFYCGCHTKAVRRREPIDIYTDRLLEEIAVVGALIGGRKVLRLHWGGGTPSMLGDARFNELVAALSRTFDFSGMHEHAIELDPRRVNRDLVRTLKAIGITRASLGVQDFSPHVQQAVGRVQPFDVVAQAVSLLRDADIRQLNIDLMYGLPRQTREDVIRSATTAASLNPDRLALFGYAHVPWFKTNQRRIAATDLPTAVERLEQARVAGLTLGGLAFHPIGLDHFADPNDELAVAQRAGRLRRNFQGYTTDEADALIGFGASSIGQLPQGYVQNAADMGGYARAVSGGQLATVKGIALNDDDRLRARIIERLMCDLRVDLDEVSGFTDAATRFADDVERLAPLAAHGLVSIDGTRINVGESGRPFLRLAAAAFDAYLAGKKAQHSAAV